jgi:hypothetical protein
MSKETPYGELCNAVKEALEWDDGKGSYPNVAGYINSYLKMRGFKVVEDPEFKEVS